MVYKWYILPIGGLYGTYHLLREPGNSIDNMGCIFLWPSKGFHSFRVCDNDPAGGDFFWFCDLQEEFF